MRGRHHYGTRHVKDRFAFRHSRIHRKPTYLSPAATLTAAEPEHDSPVRGALAYSCLTNREHVRSPVPSRSKSGLTST
jgi:hypothetical protein